MPEGPPVQWQAPYQEGTGGVAGWQTPPPRSPAAGLMFAGFWIRLAATLIDLVLLFILLIVTALIAGAAGSESAVTALVGLLWFILAVAYFPFLWIALRGQTPGMKAFNLRIVRDKDGGPISGWTAVVRYLGWFVSALYNGLGFIWVAFDPRKQGWHDKIAGTVVVRPT